MSSSERPSSEQPLSQDLGTGELDLTAASCITVVPEPLPVDKAVCDFLIHTGVFFAGSEELQFPTGDANPASSRPTMLSPEVNPDGQEQYAAMLQQLKPGGK